MTTTGLAAGTWRYRYVGNYQTAATTTGISMVTNFTGTVTTGQYAKRWTHVTTGAAASTGVGDDIAGTNTGQIVEGHSHITNNTDEGPTAGVATINANVGFVLEGFATTTTSGNLEFKMRSEVAQPAFGPRSVLFVICVKPSTIWPAFVAAVSSMIPFVAVVKVPKYYRLTENFPAVTVPANATLKLTPVPVAAV